MGAKITLIATQDENSGGRRRVFKKKEASQPEMTKTVKMQVRGTWRVAPKVTLIALESDHIADTGPT